MWRQLPLLLALTSAGAVLAGQQRIPEPDVWHIRELVAAADLAMKGEFTAETPWIDLQLHFLRGAGRQVYVPFTIQVDDVAEGSFKSVAMYVRVAKRGERTTSTDYARRSLGPEPGVGLPVFSYDAAAAASAGLRAIDKGHKQLSPYPFQAVHLTDVEWVSGAAIVRRALQVPPGSYDLYVAVRERLPASSERPRNGVLKRVLEVPDFGTGALAITPPILTADVRAVRSRLSQEQQAARPYALGAFEVTPRAGDVFSLDDELTAVVFVYNAAADGRGKPSITTEYRFYRLLGGGFVRPYAQPLHETHDATTLPLEFDMRAGHQLVPMRSVALASFAPGHYRVEVTVTDKRESATASTWADFEVR